MTHGEDSADALRRRIAELEQKLADRDNAFGERIDHQTATIDVLRAMAASPGDPRPVFDLIAERAKTLCGSANASLFEYDGTLVYCRALTEGFGPREAREEFLRSFPRPLETNSYSAAHIAISEGRIVHVRDVDKEPGASPAARRMGVRSLVGVPLMKDGRSIGAIGLVRAELGGYSDDQIALLRTFAEQAAIAISGAETFRALQTRTADLRESLKYQTATSDVLKTISRSAFDLQPVLEALIATAARLCDADWAVIYNREGEAYRGAATYSALPDYDRAFLGRLMTPTRGSIAGRAVLERQIVHVDDVTTDPEYTSTRSVSLGGGRTGLGVPLLREGAVVGVIGLARRRVHPFTDQQIDLVTTFADQAVIAMENARLITEQREALEQQTATAEVLDVINRNPGDLAPVFDVILEKAHALCGVTMGALLSVDDGMIQAMATRGYSQELDEISRTRRPLAMGVHGDFSRGARFIHYHDMTANPEVFGSETGRQFFRRADARTYLIIPLRKDDVILGAITALRTEVRPFTEKEIVLLENFAAQAVIAMENARLLEELRERTEELTQRNAAYGERIGQQAATIDVLQAMAASPEDARPVFQLIVDRARAFSESALASLALVRDGMLHDPVHSGFSPDAAKGYEAAFPRPVGEDTLLGRAVLTGQASQMPDNMADSSYAPEMLTLARRLGARSHASVPLRRDGVVIGAMVLAGAEPRAYTDAQMELLRTFAEQAVIALASAEMFQALRERTADLARSLEQQTAMAEVLAVINANPGELVPVFDTILEKAHVLCGSAIGHLALYENGGFRRVAYRGLSTETSSAIFMPENNNTNSPRFRLVQGERFVHVPDLHDPDASLSDVLTALRDQEGIRSFVLVPMRRDGALLGYISANWTEARADVTNEIALLESFAAQAVIAMENARLLTEQQEALEQQTATAEILRVINASPNDLAPVFDTILAKAHTLLGASIGTLWTYDGEYLHGVATHGHPDDVAEFIRREPVPPPIGVQKMIAGERYSQIDDMRAGDPMPPGIMSLLVERTDVRTVLAVPLRKDGVFVGEITAFRTEVRPFVDKEITLLESFAAQAVIAMENARLLTEQREALERQTATAEILRVINANPGETTPVFDAILEKSLSLAESAFGAVWLSDQEFMRAAVTRGMTPALAAFNAENPIQPISTSFRRAGETGRGVQLADMRDGEAYRSGHQASRAFGDLGGARTNLVVPLIKEGTSIGGIHIFRQDVRPFTDKQVALLESFAPQAVIAIDNARLITEQREALERQTATAEVLQVINASPGDLTPVFDAMMEKAMRLCEAAFGALALADGDTYRVVAKHNLPPAVAESVAGIQPIRPGSAIDRIMRGEAMIHTVDATTDDAGRAASPVRRAMVELGGTRTALWVALRKEGVPLGCFMAYRREVRPFTDRQIALLENFAAQAVIAMENARLLTEQREALARQTATADVLRIINESPGNLTPVFDAILEKALDLSESIFGLVYTFDGKSLTSAAMRNLPPALEAWSRDPGTWARPMELAERNPAIIVDRVILGEDVVHVTDITDDDAYRARAPQRVALADLGGARTALAVALRKDGVLLGVFLLYRQEVRAYAAEQINLVKGFAAQAVIAMENARLLTEQREALERQTAIAEVLRVINTSSGTLAPVLESVLDQATALCDAPIGIFWLSDGSVFRPAAWRGVTPEYLDAIKVLPGIPTPGLRAVSAGAPFDHILDIMNREEYTTPSAQGAVMIDMFRVRTGLVVPVFVDGTLIGAIRLFRLEVRAFTDRQIDLLRNFAAQSEIAIANARLITEQREALEQQTAMAEVLGIINANPGDLTPVFEAVLDKAMELCGVDCGELHTFDGDVFRAAALRGMPPEYAELRLANRSDPRQLAQGGGFRRIFEGEDFLHVADLKDDVGYRNGVPGRRLAVDLAGARTSMAVALRSKDRLLGAILFYRREVKLFDERQVGLLRNFAAQAVIAMENARLLTEQREALEQQTASADILTVISTSMGDTQPVFDKILDTCKRLFDGDELSVCRVDEQGLLHLAAYVGRFREAAEASFPALLEIAAVGRAIRERRVVHYPDIGGNADTPSVIRRIAVVAGYHSLAFAPMIWQGKGIGVICVGSSRRAFTERQLQVLQSFADQAVIAIQNTRLMTEQREALERQTAMADLLRVINESPGNVSPVFDAILEKAHQFCGAPSGNLTLYENGMLRAVATRGCPPEYVDYVTKPFPVALYQQRLLDGERLVHVLDGQADQDENDSEVARVFRERTGLRTLLTVPLRKDTQLLGIISAFRPEVRAFSEAEITLIENFAAQAVIAMENARLLAEQAEALERQTAVADVLQVINRSPGDLIPVFNAMLERAFRLCDAEAGALWVMDGETVTIGALAGFSGPTTEFLSRPFIPGPQTGIGRLMVGEELVQIPDLAKAPGYHAGETMHRLAIDTDGLHSLTAVPLRKDGAFLGAFGMMRHQPGHFTDKQIGLLRDFAAQAVIAMENARLLNEIRQRQGELDVTFQSMGDGVALFDDTLHLAAWNQNFQDMIDVPTEIVTAKPHFKDYIQYLADRGEYGAESGPTVQRLLSQVGQTAAFERTRPNGRVIQIRTNPTPAGGFVVMYTDITERKHAEEALRAARDAAENALRELKIAQANLVQAEKMASLGQLTAGIAHEIKNPLNFVNNFAALSVDLLAEFKETAAPGLATLTDDQRADIDDVSAMLTINLQKITEHGKRADGIVRAMLEHSRGASGERREVDLNGLVDEALNLAYHGARAQDQSFNITLERDFGADIAAIEVNPQDLTRVFLNMFTNGFYAANKRAKAGGDPNFAPVLRVTTRDAGDTVEIRVRDNGTGIPPDIRDKLFQPFFTTKPTGEGTGLGLSITYDIVTKQHGGTITVDSAQGEYAEFIVTLPRHMFASAGATP